MHGLERLIVYYNECKKDNIYTGVIKELLKNIHEIEEDNIYSLADKCYTSATTISRLSKKLGYEKFTNFKMDIISSVKNYQVLNRFVPFNEICNYGNECDTYLALLKGQIESFVKELDYEYIDKMVDIIDKFRCIKFYTNGTRFAENHLQEDLIITGHESKTLTVYNDQIEDIEDLDEETLIILICPVLQENAQNIDIIKTIREKGGSLFLITDSNYYRMREYANYVYSFDGVFSIVDDYRFAMFLNILSIKYREKYIR